MSSCPFCPTASNSDGVFEITDSASPTDTIPAAYLATVGNHTIHGRIKDKDGGFTDYTGAVFKDTNNYGKLDAGELSFTTGADGKFTFVVPAGKYNVREVLKSGFTRTTPSTGVYAVTLASGQISSGKNFGDK